jgi:hypothetical protein
MSRDGELPGFVGRSLCDNQVGRADRVVRRGGSDVPRNAILLSGGAMLVLSFSSDLPHIAYISSFSLLMYYGALNLSGLKVLRGGMRIVTALGFLSCLVLMISLPRMAWLVGAGVVAAGIVYYRIPALRPRKK